MRAHLLRKLQCSCRDGALHRNTVDTPPLTGSRNAHRRLPIGTLRNKALVGRCSAAVYSRFPIGTLQFKDRMSDQMDAMDLGIAGRIRRSRGRGARVLPATSKVSREEMNELEAAAGREGKALGEWGREVLLEAARGSQTDLALFTELTALRLLMTNVLRPLALGERLTPEDFQAIQAGVRTDKHDAAQQLLTQYQPTTAGGQLPWPRNGAGKSA